MLYVNIQLFGGRGSGSGMASGVGQVPRGAGGRPEFDREATAKTLNKFEDYAEQYQRDHRAELKHYGIKRSGFITDWKGVGGIHIWGFEGSTKAGSTYTSALNNGFETRFYTKGMNKLLGTKMYSSLDAAINGAKKYLGPK